MWSRRLTCAVVVLVLLCLQGVTRTSLTARLETAGGASRALQQPPAEASQPARDPAPPQAAAAGGMRRATQLTAPAVASCARNSPQACTFELVVCRHDEDVAWVHRLLRAAAAPSMATVINHGPALPRGQMPTDVVLVEWSMPNEGRECSCYLDHLTRRYPDFAASTLYVQADACCHTRVEQMLLSAPPAQHDFVYLTDKLYYILKNGKQERAHAGYNLRSCELQALFGRRCNRSAGGGLWLGSPGLANFQVARRRLVRTELEGWSRARHLLSQWLESESGWVACLPMERVWHVLMGEPDILPRSQALAHTARCDVPPKQGVCKSSNR